MHIYNFLICVFRRPIGYPPCTEHRLITLLVSIVIDIKVTLMSRNNGSSSMLAEFIKITDRSFE